MKGILGINNILIVSIMLLAANAFSQYTLSGIVSDAKSSEPVSGANIMVMDSKAGTSTEGSGKFQLKFQEKTIVELKFSHIGYHDSVVKVDPGNGALLNVFLEPDSVEIASIIVTATRTRNIEQNVPQRVDIISPATIDLYPATNTDDLLKMIPGVVVNRSWGIFSRNAAISLRGMPGSSRSLILLDGVPLNKTAGGTVNWHLVTPGEVERIEVVKGPGSSVYGMNAMGGTINIITKQPVKKFSGTAGLGYGSYNTLKAQLNVSGNDLKESKGLYWKLGGFYRQGDGYILEPEELRTQYSSKAFLNEGNFSGLVGYQFKKNQKLELDYRYYKDKRGSGVTVFEEDGSFESFTNNNIRAGYDCYLGKTQLTTKGFYFTEAYDKQAESVNTSDEYKLVDTKTDKQDMGIWLTFSRALNQNHLLVWGLDVKNGTLDNEEIYRTTTDELYTDGKLFFSGLFLQDEMSFLKNKIKLIAGLRFDYANFYNGWLRIENPTNQTGFPSPVNEAFPASSWTQLSPKLSARYFMHESLSTYVSASSGFMPPRLDDLAGSRKIRKGFKKANPDLKPEVINSVELGFDLGFWDKLFFKPTGFYSIGNDFQYLVATGEIIDADSDDPITVFQRQNVSKVEVAGAELGLEYNLNKNISLSGSYAYNYSEILEYSSPDGTDYTGKVLNEVPPNLVYAGLNWKNKIVDFHLDFTFTDDQWFDEENTVIVEGYSLLNLRLSKLITKNIIAILDVQDLLDEQFIDRKGYESPGRFIMFEISYLLK